jgi:hypothetical protein
MCGRTVVARSIGEIVTIFDIDDVIGDQPGIPYNNLPSLQAQSLLTDYWGITKVNMLEGLGHNFMQLVRLKFHGNL